MNFKKFFSIFIILCSLQTKIKTSYTDEILTVDDYDTNAEETDVTTNTEQTDTTSSYENQNSAITNAPKKKTPISKEGRIAQLKKEINKINAQIKTLESQIEKKILSPELMKKNPALASRVQNIRTAVQKEKDQLKKNNEEIAKLQTSTLQRSNILGKLDSKKTKKQKKKKTT